MSLIKTSIEKPVMLVVGIVFVVLFGLISLKRLPYQLSPTVTEPTITVRTTWRGATPYEVEREIIERQENTLKGITGLLEMESDSVNGRGEITLRFSIDTAVDDALLRVSNKINEVPSYPEGVDKPVITATGAAASPVIWMTMKTMEGNERSIATYLTYFEDEVRQYLERVDGVADLFFAGGTLDEMHIVLDNERMASHGISAIEVTRALATENVNVSAGNMGVGRKDYRIRTTGEFKGEDDIRAIVIRSTGQRRVLLSDIATIARGYQKQSAVVIHNGQEGIAIGIKPEPGTNILDMTRRVEEIVGWLNENKMHPKGITFHWVYDQRSYINGAIDLIKGNILIGGLLAVIVLLVFLRSVRSALIVATAIPISVIGTFTVMDLMGRNLNVVSLAGIAFAVGMLVDNAIVVIENIDRHRGLGKTTARAALDGAGEVWGAVLASTLTTIAVFLPVVFMAEEAGQLFRDIAIAVVSSITLSMIVSISVIPSFAVKLYGDAKKRPGALSNAIGTLGGRARDAIMALVGLAVRNGMTRLATVLLLITLAAVTVVALFPKMEYLPQGNRNLVISILVPPPGLSTQERREIGGQLFDIAMPYIGKPEHEGLPGIENMFYVAHESFMLFGAMSTQWDQIPRLLPLFNRMIYSIPGMYGVAMQAGIFQTNLGRGRTINVDLSSNDMDPLIQAAGMMFGNIKGAIPDVQVRPIPSIEMSYPEARFIPERDRLRAVGMSAYDLGVTLDVLMDGRDVGDFKAEGQKKIDLILKTPEGGITTPEALHAAMIVTPGGNVVPVSTLAALSPTSGITQIRHLERNRTVTLQVTPPANITLEEAMQTIEKDIFAPMSEQGMLKGITYRMSGAADKLTQTRQAMQWNFVLAAVIAYLLMAALFENFIYPMLIMLTVPMAGAGGFLGLRLLNLAGVYQPMDILTMLGFVILIGVVVNNAILIVHQALNNVRYEGMGHQEAVLESTRSRLRPIYMSATTSIFGMLPLVVSPGAGSELYRGLGSVILGGIAVSTIFTVFLIPALLSFFIRMERTQDKGESGNHDTER